MIEEDKHIGLNQEGHLDENSIAISAEWLAGKRALLDPELKKHLEHCKQCKNDVLEVSEFVNDNSAERARQKFEETCAAKYSPSIKQVSGSQFWRVAAIFLILITVTSLAIFVRPDKEDSLVNNKVPADSSIPDTINGDQENSLAVIDTLKSESDKQIKIESVSKDLFAENYIPNSSLEELIVAQFRAGGNPNIISPPKDTTLFGGKALTFLSDNPNKESLEIQILDNTGKIIKSYPEFKDVSLPVDFKLNPGLYYWKLLGVEELYQVGKITLKEANKIKPLIKK